MQLVLQDPTGSLNPRHSVYEAVAEGPRTHGMDDEAGRVTRALSQAGLRPPERFFLRYPHELSGGQRQRVVIAGALALDPEVIIADEPVSSLDASVRGEILALMLKLREELGLTLLVVTHDLGLAWNIADRIVVMYLGRVVEQGPTEEVLSNPQHPYTRALLSVVPEMHGIEQIVLSGETPDPTKIPSGCRFHPRCQEVRDGVAERAGVLAACSTISPAILPPSIPIGVSTHDLTHEAACHLVVPARRPELAALDAVDASLQVGAAAALALVDLRRHRRDLGPGRQRRTAAHLLELGARRHLLGEQRGLDAVEEPLEPADQLSLGDPQLGLARARCRR